MILGLVQWMQPVHGYDVRRELLSWNADEWANVAPGSIYHALRKLAEEGLLEEVATEQVGARPARTTYRIDGQGRRRVRGAAAAVLVGATTSRSIRSWRRSRSCPTLPRDEARGGAAQPGAAAADGGRDGLRASLDSDWMRTSKPAHVAWMFERSDRAHGGRDPLVRAGRRRGSRRARRYFPETMRAVVATRRRAD